MSSKNQRAEPTRLAGSSYFCGEGSQRDGGHGRLLRGLVGRANGLLAPVGQARRQANRQACCRR